MCSCGLTCARFGDGRPIRDGLCDVNTLGGEGRDGEGAGGRGVRLFVLVGPFGPISKVYGLMFDFLRQL